MLNQIPIFYFIKDSLYDLCDYVTNWDKENWAFIRQNPNDIPKLTNLSREDFDYYFKNYKTIHKYFDTYMGAEGLSHDTIHDPLLPVMRTLNTSPESVFMNIRALPSILPSSL